MDLPCVCLSATSLPAVQKTYTRRIGLTLIRTESRTYTKTLPLLLKPVLRICCRKWRWKRKPVRWLLSTVRDGYWKMHGLPTDGRQKSGKTVSGILTSRQTDWVSSVLKSPIRMPTVWRITTPFSAGLWNRHDWVFQSILPTREYADYATTGLPCFPLNAGKVPRGTKN